MAAMAIVEPKTGLAPTEEANVTGRNDLLVFCALMDDRFERANHTLNLIDKLEAVERGDIKRLIVTLPPRHGKSLLISQLFPCWFLGRNPRAQIIQTGYGKDIALFHSKRARDYFTSARFHGVFPGVMHEPERPAQEVVEVSQQSAHEWGSRQGGRYYAVGIGGGITGRGADLGIIDDPLKNREEANSPTQRQKVLDWYRSTFYTRLAPDGRLVLVMTRWHKADLVGTLLAEMLAGEGEKWEVLNCPAIDDLGGALWPERWPIERLMQVKAAIGSAEFSALYQQEPTDPESGLLRREWFRIAEEWPASITRWVRYWDLAATVADGTNDPDWTAGALVGVHEGVWYIRDIRRGRWTPKVVQDTIGQTAALDPRGTMIRMEQEGGASGKSLVDHYARHVLVGRDFAGIPSLKSKEIRAGPLSAAAEAGNVVLVRGEWNGQFLDQSETFPFGDHDDLIDSVTGGLNVIGGEGVAGAERARQNRADGAGRGIERMMM